MHNLSRLTLQSFILYSVLLWMPWAQAGQSLSALPSKPVAPDFVLKDLEGNRHRLSDYRGKPIIVNFWATWCPPCRREMPSMQRAWEKLKQDGIMMLAINIGQTEDMIEPFVFEYDLSFPILLDIDSSVIKRWRVRGLPSTFVVDPQGRIVYRAVGGREWDDPALLDKVYALKSHQDDNSPTPY